MTALLQLRHSPVVCTAPSLKPIRPSHVEHAHALRPRVLIARHRGNCKVEAGADRSEDEPEPAKSSIPDAVPDFNNSNDWRSFRARLVAGESKADASPGSSSSSSDDSTTGQDNGDMWVHTVSQVESGMILVANPLMFQSQQEYFSQAVILIFAHDEKGTCGLILNKPTEYTIGKLVGPNPDQMAPQLGRLMPEFEQCTINVGGDVGQNTLHLLHSHNLPGTLEVMPGLHLGGIDEAKAGIARSEFSPENFKMLVRYSGWSPGQLERECKLGVWYMAAASRDFILKQSSSGKDMWHAALDLMGGDFLSLSTACRDSYDASVMEYEKPEEPQQDS